MFGLISSTLYPPSKGFYGGARSVFTCEERLKQTKASVLSLIEMGIKEVYLADNSGSAWRSEAEMELMPAKVTVFDQFQLTNKGISEILLLLGMVTHLPKDG